MELTIAWTASDKIENYTNKRIVETYKHLKRLKKFVAQGITKAMYVQYFSFTLKS